MAAYLLAAVCDRLKTRARCRGSGPAVSASWSNRSRRMRGVGKNHAMNTAKASTLLDGLLPHRGPTRSKTGRPRPWQR